MTPRDTRVDASTAALQLRLVDLLLLLGGFVALTRLLGQDVSRYYLLLLTLTLLLFELFAQVSALYRNRWRALRAEISHLLLLWAAVSMALLAMAFAFKVSAIYSRRFLGAWGVLTPIAMSLWRVALHAHMRRANRHGMHVRRQVFVGAGTNALRLAERLADAPESRIVGVYDDRAAGRLVPGALALLGGTAALLDDARAGRIDDVFITLPLHAQKRIIDLVNELADTTASVYIVPDAFVFDMMQATWSSIAGYPIISINDSPLFGVDGSFKRLEDLVLGSLILALISPLMLLIAIGVKWSSPGPVLFRQRRYGLNGHIVEVWKFRSMTVVEDGDRVEQATRGDARVTRFGAFLRAHSLDELPQFFNVLQGRMSIVGPRPHAVLHNEQYRRLIHGYMLRHKVKPGITGWAQINGWRGETDTVEKMRKRVECDLYYMRNWSIWLDLRIIALTVLKGFNDRNAY